MLEGDSSTTMPSSGRVSPERRVHRGGAQRVGLRRRLGLAERLRSLAVRLRDGLEQRLRGELDIRDDRVPHRRPRRLVRVARDRHELRAIRKQRPRDVRVVREDRGAEGEHQVVALEHLAERADRGRQRAAEVRMALREADPAPARRGRRPHGKALALGQGDRGVPGPACVDVGTRNHRRVPRLREAIRQRSDQLRIGHRPSAHGARDRTRDVAVVHLGVPVVHRDRDERGPFRRQRGDVDRTRQSQWHVLGARRLVAPLHERVRDPNRVAVGEVGLQRDHRPDLLARRDHEG